MPGGTAVAFLSAAQTLYEPPLYKGLDMYIFISRAHSLNTVTFSTLLSLYFCFHFPYKARIQQGWIDKQETAFDTPRGPRLYPVIIVVNHMAVKR